MIIRILPIEGWFSSGQSLSCRLLPGITWQNYACPSRVSFKAIKCGRYLFRLHFPTIFHKILCFVHHYVTKLFFSYFCSHLVQFFTVSPLKNLYSSFPSFPGHFQDAPWSILTHIKIFQDAPWIYWNISKSFKMPLDVY